jgi:hypothetical protein
MSIQQQQITVDDLMSNWESDAAIDYPPERMPPWDAVCNDLNWRPFCCQILGTRFETLSFGYPGVYRLIGLESPRALRSTPNGIPRLALGGCATINRACGQDTTGTLYIGKGRPLSSRLDALRRSLRHGSFDHGAPETLRYYLRLNQTFPPDQLAIAVFPCSNCEYVECDLLDVYINSFGEIPPLNLRRG